MFRSLVGAVALVVAAGAAQAQSIVSTGQSFISARFLPGAQLEDGSRMAGLRLMLEDGWKTYWRSPGDAGIPPRLDWSGSRNIASAEVLWPRPEVFQSFGLRTIGYSGQVVLPVRLVPDDPDAPMDVVLTADLGVCKELCVLERFDLAETIPPGGRSIGWRQINRALEAVPVDAADAGMTASTCRITGAGVERRLEAVLEFGALTSGVEVLVEGDETLWVRDAESEARDGQVHVHANVRLADGAGWLDRSAIRMTVLADGFAADIRGCRSSAG